MVYMHSALENIITQELARGTGLSIINLVNAILEQADELRASDIHIDTGAEVLKIRFRIDGVLQDIFALPKNIQAEIISRIKIVSGLRTDEHQAAQDGRFRIATPAGKNIDIRVSIAPTYYGENAVMRLLSDQAEEFTLELLGFSAANRKKILQALQRPHGMILATGPTGSGKTTTLYSLIKLLNTRDISIITVEDPIEYAVSGINQMQVSSRSQLTFANGLRAILRQDPDIIMVGEIRDGETAALAVNTALTGHLLLSTLHTNDAATTLPRLLDLKIEPYLVASTVNLTIGQRLVRKICADCKIAKEFSVAEQQSLLETIPQITNNTWDFFYGSGCEACNFSGYRGRMGVHEVLVPDEAISEAVLRKASAAEIRTLAISRGMVPMIEDGLEKVRAGFTTIEEIVRMIQN